MVKGKKKWGGTAKRRHSFRWCCDGIVKDRVMVVLKGGTVLGVVMGMVLDSVWVTVEFVVMGGIVSRDGRVAW